ncbi:Ca2+-binding protein, EF-hand superfamily [Saccharopolyspora kobensis]|uniref:Ca2+-binding protein, EF-hand superfamily n=1 Tax=Saccharopolyspora kobensis TaxID=146035 RepID=A0A1H6AMQ2_9PSEU|nr:EF-hand domain-containing protein [Saccharopolyspora kobensis]SEG49682.1 Ca2+-binding protein, EF-hand superfamily [Saccharopolyspora kobensis]SFE75017.1 Ca2+-binding protein, EF-hand superfamily [Saccharopolyspora kobensis]
MANAIATERLRKRFAKWDADGSGSLERSDFEQEAAEIAQAFGKSATSPQARALTDAFTSMFEQVAKGAGSLSEEQFIAAAGPLVEAGAESKFDQVLGPVVKGVVGLCDQNNDGQINGEEFATWLIAVGVDESKTATLFEQVDKDGNGELSVDELLAVVRDFHYGKSDVELLG